jgi:hypothetical protein
MDEKPLDKLSRVTGLSPKTMHDIFQKVKANQALLKSCVLHEFTIEERKIGNLVRDWKCAKCGGVVESSHKRWYELGLIHAKYENKNNSAAHKG